MSYNNEALDYLTGRINSLFEFNNYPYRIFWKKAYKKYIVGYTLPSEEGEAFIRQRWLLADVSFKEAYSFLKGIECVCLHCVLNLKGIIKNE